MALSAAPLSISLPFSSLVRVTAATRTKPSPCKLLNSGFNLAQKKQRQSPWQSSFVTRSHWENSASASASASTSTSTSGVAKETKQEEKAQGSRIWLSDVVVRNRRPVFWQRKWNALDITHAAAILTTHLLALCAPFYFTWPAFRVAFVLGIVSGLGITLSYHRNLCHKSFKLPKWLEYLFAYCGVQALQGSPIFWVSTHRCHHQFTDTERDPHSPIQGFWFSHINWIFDTKTLSEKCGTPSNVGDLEKQPFYRFLHTTYFLHPIATGVLLYAIGGFPFLVWGMGVRIVFVLHVTFFINSVSHVWGKQAWNTRDLSRNNWWLGLISFGEGWHNNHHAFEYSARHGFEWWEIDLTWYVIRFLQVVGLATDVKLPSEEQKQKMSFNQLN